MTRYRAEILIADGMGDAPRAWVQTKGTFGRREDAEAFADQFTSWVPYSDHTIVEVSD